MNQPEYQQFLATIRQDERFGALRSLAPIQVRIWASSEDPVRLPRSLHWPEPVRIAPYELVRLFRARLISAISLELDAPPPRARCVFSCPDGTISESKCSNDADDIRNCLDAVKSRCGSGSSKVNIVEIDPRWADQKKEEYR
jgi:hypothetical protein